MKKKRYLLTGLLFVSGLIAVLLFNRGGSEDLHPVPAAIPLSPVMSAVDSLIASYRDTVSSLIDSADITGGALAVVHRGEVKMLACFGERLDGSTMPVNKHTIFRLASVSKTMTGTLAGILDTEGILPLETRLSTYLKSFRLRDSLNTLALNAEHLLSHTSGLVPHAYDNLVEAGVKMNIIMDSLFRVNISAGPGQLYGYQNVIFSLYDTLAQKITGKSFGDLMKEKVFDPLHMPDASVGLQAYMENRNKAYPHNSSGRLYKDLLNREGYYITLPAAGVNASIYDLSSFMIAMLGHSENLQENVISKVLDPRVVSPLNWRYLRNWDEVSEKYYALGWRIIDAYGSRFAYHGGYVRGFRSELLICPAQDFGIAWLSNSPSGIDSEIIPLFLKLYFER